VNVEIGAEAALFPEKEYINGIAFAVCDLNGAEHQVDQGANAGQRLDKSVASSKHPGQSGACKCLQCTAKLGPVCRD
jgi:hypothetical protein